MTSLRDLSKEMMEVRELATNTDLPPEAMIDTLDGIEGMFNDKALKVVQVLNNGDSDVAALKAEAQRLLDRAKVISNGQDRLREYLRMNMEATEIKKIESPFFTITLIQGRDMAVIDDEKSVPDEYVNVKTVVAPDKRAILAALKKGVDIDGAHIEKSKSSIRIK